MVAAASTVYAYVSYMMLVSDAGRTGWEIDLGTATIDVGECKLLTHV
jgi:hypothetical protein